MEANNSLKDYTCSDEYHRYMLGLLLTSGAKAMADTFECYWFIDVIASYQPKMKDDFQVWTLTKNIDRSADVICTDGNDNILKRQHIPYTDFKVGSAVLWVEGNVILLPSEH